MTPRDSQAAKALAELAEEARRLPIPELGENFEAALLARVARENSAPRVKTRPRAPWIVAASIAAFASVAVAAIGLHGKRAVTTEPKTAVAENAPSRSGANGVVDGDRLAIGAPVISEADPVVVAHTGHATWTLAPNGQAHVESSGDVIHVALDRGELSAKVVKSKLPESFVVRVERMQVAVHGTEFRVERLPSTVRVQVTDGVVGVGPVGGKEFELVAPASATVTWDGVRADEAGGAPTRPTTSVVTPAATRAKICISAVGGAEARPAGTNGVDDVVRVVEQCFGAHTVSRGDLKVTVSTRMSLHVRPDGTINDSVFNPPLVDGVRECVDREASLLQFPPSTTERSFGRVLELDR